MEHWQSLALTHLKYEIHGFKSVFVLVEECTQHQQHSQQSAEREREGQPTYAKQHNTTTVVV
eukprot:scaffold4347_cov269-Ochromonas_danica.AAC.12